MNYCLIDEAWGYTNSPSEQYKKYVNSCSNNDTNKVKNEPLLKINEQFVNTDPTIKNNNEYDCRDFMIHLKSCKRCYNKMKNQFSSHLIEHFNGLIDENKDTIVLILIGISILLFINLINNITKN